MSIPFAHNLIVGRPLLNLEMLCR